MKANELRIGNLIFEEETQEVGQVNTVILGIIDEGLSHTYKPIPLTEEWLERFNWNPPKDIGVAFSTNTHEIYFVAGNYYKTIEYVHQLQNLYFALTGEELEIKDTAFAQSPVLGGTCEYFLRAEPKKCKYVKREGESCTLNDNCTYPNCKE